MKHRSYTFSLTLAISILCCIPQNLSGIATGIQTLFHPISGKIVTIVYENPLLVRQYFSPKNLSNFSEKEYDEFLKYQLVAIDNFLSDDYDHIISHAYVPPQWQQLLDQAAPTGLMGHCSLAHMACRPGEIVEYSQEEMDFFDVTQILLHFEPVTNSSHPEHYAFQKKLFNVWHDNPITTIRIMDQVDEQIKKIQTFLKSQQSVFDEKIYEKYLRATQNFIEQFDFTARLSAQPSHHKFTQENYSKTLADFSLCSFVLPTLQSILSPCCPIWDTHGNSYLIIAYVDSAYSLAKILVSTYGFISTNTGFTETTLRLFHQPLDCYTRKIRTTSYVTFSQFSQFQASFAAHDRLVYYLQHAIYSKHAEEFLEHALLQVRQEAAQDTQTSP